MSPNVHGNHDLRACIYSVPLSSPQDALEKPGMSGRGVTSGGSKGRFSSLGILSSRPGAHPRTFSAKHTKAPSLEIDTPEALPGDNPAGFWVCINIKHGLCARLLPTKKLRKSGQMVPYKEEKI